MEILQKTKQEWRNNNPHLADVEGILIDEKFDLKQLKTNATLWKCRKGCELEILAYNEKTEWELIDGHFKRIRVCREHEYAFIVIVTRAAAKKNRITCGNDLEMLFG